MRLIVLLTNQKDYEHFNQVPVEIGKIEVSDLTVGPLFLAPGQRHAGAGK